MMLNDLREARSQGWGKLSKKLDRSAATDRNMIRQP